MKKIKKLFIATSSFNSITSQKIKSLKKKGLLVIKNPLKKKLDKSNLIKFAKDADFIIAGTEVYNDEVLSKLYNLKFLFRLGSGIDNINLSYLKKKKIIFKKSTITPEISVAELIIGFIIVLLRQIHISDYNIKNGVWKKNMGSILFGKKVGIIGYGKVGGYLHKLLKNFGAEIYINEIKKNNNIKFTGLKHLLKNSDIVTINTSLKSPKVILNKTNLDLLKKNCILINTSRPEVIDYNYLYYILKKNKILGAGLDVFHDEPYYGKLKNLPNVILTPHIGGYSKEIRLKMELEGIKEVQKYIL